MPKIFSEVLDYYAPLKQKSAWGNHVLFMSRELSKATKTKSKVKNSYVKWPSQENFVAWQLRVVWQMTALILKKMETL